MKSQDKTTEVLETFTVSNDSGKELTFSGRLASESSHYDEEAGCLTKLRLFTTKNLGLVYSIVSSTGDSRSRRFYTIKIDGDMCTMHDGVNFITMPLFMLYTAVFGLCGIDPSVAEEIRPALEKVLEAANG